MARVIDLELRLFLFLLVVDLQAHVGLAGVRAEKCKWRCFLYFALPFADQKSKG